ncbi:MAG: hypothetical protein WAU23_08755 [Ferruginibacter sp.]
MKNFTLTFLIVLSAGNFVLAQNMKEPRLNPVASAASNQTGTGSLILLSPSDGKIVTAESSDKPIFFRWTSLPGATDYTIEVVEITGYQSPEEAIMSGTKTVVAGSASTSGYMVKPADFDHSVATKKYAWIVRCGNIRSDVHSFTIVTNNRKISKLPGTLSTTESVGNTEYRGHPCWDKGD